MKKITIISIIVIILLASFIYGSVVVGSQIAVNKERYEIVKDLKVTLGPCYKYVKDGQNVCRIEDKETVGMVVHLDIAYEGLSAAELQAEINRQATQAIEEYADKIIAERNRETTPTITLTDERTLEIIEK